MKTYQKVISIGLCAALALGGTGIYALADGREAPAAGPAAGSLSAASAGEEAAVKDETVYVLARADGSVDEIIVSDWIKNTLGSDTIGDKSQLTGVENVKGDESYTVSGGGQVWDARGNDIYYRGTIEKALPVDLSVSYTLDGRTVSPEELAGKSGRVSIRFAYTNNQYEMKEIDGKQERIHVPFAMLTGVLLDNGRFHNVEVSNGRLYNDGDRTAVIGIAFPGMQENLDIEKDRLEIPDYVEITADVEGFELGTTFTLAASDMFKELDTDELNIAGDLNGELEEMAGAMEQLLDGSSRLYEGLCTLLERSSELVDGIGQLADGAQALRDGAQALQGGAQALHEGAGELSEGIQTLQDGTQALAEGVNGLEAGAAGLTDGAEKLREGSATLAAGLDALSANSQSLNGGAEQVFETLLASAGGQLASAGVEAPALTAENYGQVLDGVIAALPEGTSGQVEALKASLDSYNAFCRGLQNYTAGVDSAAAGAQGIQSGAGELAAGAGQLKAGAGQLKEGAGELNTGAGALKSGAEQMQGGAAALCGGTAELYNGACRLYDGILTLRNGAPALVEGVTELRDGAMQLSNGLEEFNEKGVQKLIDAVDGDLEGLMDRVRATAEAAKSYQSFSGISEEMDGQVKFVYRTGAIESGE